jgi:predicted amidohydrolase
MNLVSLQFKTISNFKENLNKLISLINLTSSGAFILAPELCLTGYAYNKLEDAINITQESLPILLNLSSNKTIALTLATKQNNKYFNTLHIFHKNRIIHTQSKHKLFTLGDEDKYFTSGDIENIKIIDIDGIKIASLICFELRFIQLWQRIQGADIVLIPAMWGKLRKKHFEILTQALAISNQCFIIVSDSANNDMAQSSAIISPFGKRISNDKKTLISQAINLNEIKKMRKYLNIGIK